MTKASNGSRSIRTLIQTTQSLPASCAIPCCTSKVTCKNNRINKASDQSCLNIPAMSTDGPDREERKCCLTSFRTSGRIRGSWTREEILLKQVAVFLINGMNAPARLFQRPLTETLLQPFPRRLASRLLKPRPSHTCNIKASEQQDLWPLMKHISPEKRKVEHHQQDTDNDLR